MSNFKTLQVTDDLSVQVIPSKEHVFIMSTNEVAHGYDCSTDAIKKARQRHSDELIEGKHFYSERDKMSPSGNLQTQRIYWTKRGIVRLGFFLTSERAKQFRDWAEDLIINGGSSRPRLREDEKTLLALLNQYLLLGDQVKIAKELGVRRNTVNAVKCGRTRSARIMGALVEQAIQNQKSGRQLVIGYSADFVDLAVRKLKGGLNA